MRRLSKWEQQQQALETAQAVRMTRYVRPIGDDSVQTNQPIAFDYRVFEIREDDLHRTLNNWGACGWEMRNVFRDTTAMGYPTYKCMVILQRRRNV